MSSFPATPEQVEAGDLAASGQHLVIEALAGTGKTSTLRYIAGERLPDRRIQYVAFNKAIVQEAEASFPDNVACNTAHSLAYRACGYRYRTRLNGGRVRSDVIARALNASDLWITAFDMQKRMSAAFLASQARKTVDVFARTGDPEITEWHMPTIEGIDEPKLRPDGSMAWRGPNNQEIAKHVAVLARRYWQDVERIDGRLPFSPNYYMKLWQLGDPIIDADVIMYDEGQDANGCMLAIVEAQADHAQLIYVGDTFQQIYGWNGAVNSLATAKSDLRCWLTQSFRFGPAIAAIANLALDALGATVSVKGTDTVPSRVVVLDQPDVILTRTNACAVQLALRHMRDGLKVAIVGGADEVVRFAEGALKLQNGEKAWQHPDLQCFDTWAEVEAYVQLDPMGGDLKLMVDLMDEFHPEVIIRELAACTNEDRADIVISTAHKAKGREWNRVQLAGDFPDPEVRDASDEEVRLMYVAVTRARLGLDVSAVRYFKDVEHGAAVGAP